MNTTTLSYIWNPLNGSGEVPHTLTAEDVMQRLGADAKFEDAYQFIKTWNIRFYDAGGVPTFHDQEDLDESWAETVELMA